MFSERIRLSSLNDTPFPVFIVRKLQERARRAGLNPNSVSPPSAKVLRKLFARLVPEIVDNIHTLDRRRILVLYDLLTQLSLATSQLLSTDWIWVTLVMHIAF